jgi:spermidine synthase
MHLDYELIDRDPTPLGELSLYRYRNADGDSGYEIRIDDNFLMASHGALGEVVMVQAAAQRLPKDMRDLSVLVGGLGAGHTLRAVLDRPGVAQVTVAEIGAKVADWNRLYFADTNGHAVDDPRVRVVVGDVAALIARSPHAFDLMLLDVDNGPDWLATQGNAALYTPEGLTRCKQALTSRGVLAIWSPGPNPLFETALKQVFADWQALRSVDLDPQAGPTDVVYLAGG